MAWGAVGGQQRPQVTLGRQWGAHGSHLAQRPPRCLQLAGPQEGFVDPLQGQALEGLTPFISKAPHHPPFSGRDQEAFK